MIKDRFPWDYSILKHYRRNIITFSKGFSCNWKGRLRLTKGIDNVIVSVKKSIYVIAFRSFLKCQQQSGIYLTLLLAFWFSLFYMYVLLLCLVKIVTAFIQKDWCEAGLAIVKSRNYENIYFVENILFSTMYSTECTTKYTTTTTVLLGTPGMGHLFVSAPYPDEIPHCDLVSLKLMCCDGTITCGTTNFPPKVRVRVLFIT